MEWTVFLVCCGFLWCTAGSNPVPRYEGLTPVRSLRSDDRSAPRYVNKAVNTTARLAELRQLLETQGLHAYIVNSEDEHQSEFTADYDHRREYISGFSGSSGNAVVTRTKAALWTDSRYYIQAEQQLDNNWELMKSGVEGTPSVGDWLKQELQPGQAISMDPKISTFTNWQNLEKMLGPNITLKVIADNLIDDIWGPQQGRPPYPDTPIMIHDVKYAGMTWEDKLKTVRNEFSNSSSQALILSTLVEVAWLLNLRGGDIPFTPVFRGYVVIGVDYATLYIPSDKITDLVKEHLNADKTRPGDSVQVEDYMEFWSDLKEIGQKSDIIQIPGPYGQEMGASYLIYNSLPMEKIKVSTSPVLLLKGVKNSIEAEGLRNAHIKDAVALCQLLSTIEQQVTQGDTSWNEIKAAKELDAMRSKQKDSFGPSFYSIVASGAHAAIVHYQPEAETNAPINTTAILLIDSGGQYLDGTTDVTRTMYYGEPSDFIKTVYTTLLIGCIELATVTFKKGNALRDFEIIVRSPLYALGLDYGHGTTHGIGMFLSVHEAFDQQLKLNYFGSQEPGYYRTNEFGIRLENIVTVVKANVTPGEPGDEFYNYETVTLVPYERNLIDLSLLQPKHINYINSYHAKIADIVGSEMLNQGLNNEYEWLIEKTTDITKTIKKKNC